MKLDKNWRIEKDTYSTMLRYESDPFEKEIKGEMKMVTTKEDYYFPSLQSALKAYVEKSPDTNSIESVNRLIERLDEVYENIEKLVKGTKIM